MRIEGTRFETGRRYYSNRRAYMDVIIYDVSGEEPNRVGMVKFFGSGGSEEHHVFREGMSTWFDRFLRGGADGHYNDTPPVKEPEVGETWMSYGFEVTLENTFRMMRGGRAKEFGLITLSLPETDDSFKVLPLDSIMQYYPRNKD